MRHHSLRGLLLAFACLGTLNAPIARAADPGPPALRVDPLVEQFIRSTAIVAARLSPDGKHIAAIARSGLDSFAMLVDVDTHAAHMLAQPLRRAHGVWDPSEVAWVDPSRLVLNYNVRRAELAGGLAYSTAIDLQGHVIAKLGTGTIAIQRDEQGQPTGWVLTNRERDGFWVDRINLATHESLNYTFDVPGRKRLDPVFDARGDILAVRTVDTAFWSDVSRVATWYRPDTATPWAKVDERSVNDDPFVPVMVSSRPGHLVVLARNGGDRRAAWDYDVARHAFGDRLAADDADDVEAARFEAGSSSVVGFRTGGMRPRQIWLDPEMARLQALVDGARPDHVNVLSRSGAAQVAVWSYSDTGFGRMSVLDPKTLKMQEIFVASPEIDATHMQPMQLVHYPSTDGTDIPAYLTMPGHPAGPAPLIVLVHGGPIARDTWGWHEDVQLFAAHGYAVLQPQFRGSAGFGLRFQQAGYRQWGRKAQDDISAGVRELVARKLVDPARVCIVGTSYGGYAALWGLASTPELYKCGVDTSGVSDIEDEVTHASAGSRSGLVREVWSKWYGDPEQMRAAWAEVSPRRHADRIQAPLLIVHGEDDEIVPIAHGKKMRDALLDLHKDVQWLDFESEAHGVVQPADRRIWYGAMLELFARTIGEGEPPFAPPPSAVQAAQAFADANHLEVWRYGRKP